MKFTELWGRVVTVALALACAVTLAASPGHAQSSTTTTITTTQTTLQPVTVTNIRFPATVTRVGPDTVTLSVRGSSLDLPASFGTYTLNGQPVQVTTLQSGQNVMVAYPQFSGTVSSLNGNMVLLQSSDGSTVMVPVTALSPALRTDMVFVRLSNGQYVQVPLSTAIDLQMHRNATIVSALPNGVMLSPYATGDDVMSPRNRGINFSEGVRIQKDPSKLIQDQSIDGDSRY